MCVNLYWTSNSILVMWFISLLTPPLLNWSSLNNVNYYNHFFMHTTHLQKLLDFAVQLPTPSRILSIWKKQWIELKIPMLEDNQIFKLWRFGKNQWWHHVRSSHLYLQCSKWQSHFTCTWDYDEEPPLMSNL